MSKSAVNRFYHSLPDSVQSYFDTILRETPFSVLKWYFGTGNYLREQGWFASERTGIPVNSKGEPIPWFSYPSIDFLEDRLSKDMTVFEYGCGNSTLWWSDHVGSVTGVEHNSEWASKMETETPDNANVIHYPEGEDYINAINEQDAVNIAVVDGLDRGDCVRASLNNLTEDGVLILDDFYRQPQSVYEPLENQGFKHLSFYGATPIGPNGSSTAVFYRSENCLNI